jgi:hypothetical protein
MPAPKVRQFAGDFRWWRKSSTGVLTPVIPDATDTENNQPIETNAFSFAYAAGDETTINSKRRGALYNQPIYTDTLPGTTSVSATLLEVPTAILARVLYGEAASADITTGSVTDGSLTVERLDAPIQLPHRYISASPTPTFATVTPTSLVEGTDYTLDLRRGTITILSAGTVGATIAVDDVLTVNYSYESVTGTTILGGATPTESFFITGDMEDRVSGEQGYLQVYEVKLSVDGDIDWLATEPLSPTLTGKALVPNGAPAPYKFDVYKQAA